MGPGSSGWANHNAAKGHTGQSKWTKADFKANFGTSPAGARRKSTPSRKKYTDAVPF